MPLTLGEVRELMQADANSAPAGEIDLGIHIVVLQRGWVAVGWLFRIGPQMRLRGASIVRRWGTTRGLGQIAAEGPTDETVLDPSPAIQFHELTAVLTIACDESKWSDKCKLKH